jgi:hypothetical protein
MCGKLVQRLFRILEDSGASPREATSAAKAILSASKLNQTNIPVTVQAKKYFDLEGRVTDLEKGLEKYTGRNARGVGK